MLHYITLLHYEGSHNNALHTSSKPGALPCIATLHHIATFLIWIAFQGAAISRALCCGRIATLLQASLECDTIYTGISITNVPQKYAGVFAKYLLGITRQNRKGWFLTF